MSTSPFVYKMLEDVERLEYYRPGGFHPIQVGDRFIERYRIVHKLGYGSFSTIWLARDETTSRYVAVKVCTADSVQQEADTLSRLGEADPHGGFNGRDLAPVVLDRFRIQGPNGTHACLVTTPARCSLADTREASFVGLFQLDVARSLAAQLALAVAYIHEQGLVHGDLHLGNLLLRFPSSLDNLTEKELYETYGAPEPEAVVREDGKPLGQGVPSHVIPPVWLGKPCEDITPLEAHLLLADFGVAFRPSTELRYQSYAPLEIRPPEARFEPTIPLSFVSDIWSLGCTIWALVANRPLVEMVLSTEDDVTAQHVDALGPLPEEWWEKWGAWNKYFTQPGAAGRPIEGRWVWSLEDRFEEWAQKLRREEGMATLDDRERDAFLKMVRLMLRFRPGDRPTAKQVLETEWMREWALPERERLLK